jgi:hypothetical protein
MDGLNWMLESARMADLRPLLCFKLYVALRAQFPSARCLFGAVVRRVPHEKDRYGALPRMLAQAFTFGQLIWCIHPL